MTLARVKVEIGFPLTSSTSTDLFLNDAVRGKLGTGTLAADQSWVDVTSWVSAWTVRRGASRSDGPVLRYDAGTCTVTLDNSDRRFDPTNLAGPYVSAGVSQIAPRRPVRISGAWGGTTYPLFRGFVDGWPVQWDDGPARTSTVTLTATDATRILSNYDGVALATPVGDGETSGARVNRILDSAGWPGDLRDVADGDSVLQGTTLAQAAWTELLLVSDTEFGELYVDASGSVVFRNRRAAITEGRSTTSQLALGDAAGELNYEGLAIAYDDSQIVNLALISRVGGTQQQAADAASQQAYLKRTANRTDLLMTTDQEAASYAGFLVYQGKDPELRFDSVDLDPTTQDALWPHVLGREFGDRITISRRPPGGGVITREVFVRGVTHAGSASRWTTSWSLQSAAKYAFLTLNHRTQGALGVNALAY